MTILLIEDDPQQARLIHEMIKGSSSYVFRVTQVEHIRDAERCLATSSVDIVVLDLGMADLPGLDAVRRVQAVAPRVSIVLRCSADDEGIAALAIHEGAQDYLVKGQIEPRALIRSLLNSAERRTIEETLFNEKERAQVTLDCIGYAVICTDTAGNITFLNPVAERMTGWPIKDAAGWLESIRRKSTQRQDEGGMNGDIES